MAQGFPVTGADSRTAVNNALGGKSQLVSIVAAATMLFVLLFLKAPLALVPTVVLAAVVFASALTLFDVTGLGDLARMSWREGLLSLGTTLSVLVLGVLPGVLLAVALSLAWLLMVASRPKDAVLGRVPGLPGFHSVADYPKATTVPGLLLYRFEANLVFFNVDYFGVCAAIAASRTPVEWVVVDASPINWIDATASSALTSCAANWRGGRSCSALPGRSRLAGLSIQTGSRGGLLPRDCAGFQP